MRATFRHVFKSLFIAGVTLAFAATGLAADEEEGLEVIVVKGIKGSLISSQQAKSAADSVVDVITMQDLGEFPDQSLADALQRVPGVQIERNVTGIDGDRVALRGMSGNFVTTTVNGRTPLSGGTQGFNFIRSFNADMIPTEVLSSVYVYKTPEATITANGIGGHVDLRTLRPLDLPYGDGDFTGSVSAKGIYDDYAGEWGSKIDGLIAGRFADGNAGFYIAVESTDHDRSRDQIRYITAARDIHIDTTGDGVADTIREGILAPNFSVHNGINENIVRDTISASLQFRPNDTVGITWDLLYTDFENNSHRQRVQPIIQGRLWGPGVVWNADSIVVRDLSNVSYVESFDGSGQTGGADILINSGPFRYNTLTENLMTGVQLDLQINDALSMRVDVNYSEIELLNEWPFAASNLTVPAGDVTFDISSSVISWDLGPALQDVSNYGIGAYTVTDNRMEADQAGLAFDFSYDVGGLVTSVDFGLRHVGLDQANLWLRSGIPIDAADQQEFLDLLFSEDRDWQFMRGTDGGSPHSWPWASLDPVNDVFGVYSLSGRNLANINRSYGIEEDVTAAYVQVNLEGELGNTAYTANLGLRAEKTDTAAEGTLIFTGAPNEPIVIDNDYTHVLPSINVNFALKEDLHLRVGLSETISRPDPVDIGPRIFLPLDHEILLSASGGNPFLEPYTATQLDLTAEYYTANDGMVVASWFFKDVQDFIISRPEQAPVPGLDPNIIYTISRPQNYSDGEITGFELGFHQPIGENWGVQANYTFINSSFDKDDVGDAGFGFPGASQDNFNSVLYYDNGTLSVRLAYTYRSDYFNALGGAVAGQNQNPRFTEAQSRLDAVVNYQFNDNLKVFANLANITEEDRRDFNSSKGLYRDYFTQRGGATIGVTYSF